MVDVLDLVTWKIFNHVFMYVIELSNFPHNACEKWRNNGAPKQHLFFLGIRRAEDSGEKKCL